MRSSSSTSERPLSKQADRLLSLDVFRGMTVAAMILVNSPGSWSHVYPPLLHAEWHGATPTDWIFPFFLFIVGVAIPLALGKRIERGDPRPGIVGKILRRTAVIFGLGLFLAAFPDFRMRDEWLAWRPLHYLLLAVLVVAVVSRELLDQPQFASERNRSRRRLLGLLALIAAAGMIVLGLFAYDFSHLRIPGVLQRIALVYGACALLYLVADWRGQLATAVAILLGYWFLMTRVPVPGVGPPSLEPGQDLGAWLDRTLLGTEHLWSRARTWDPEGLASTLPAIATGILGMLTGSWIRSTSDAYRRLTGIFAVGTLLLALGLAWHPFFPLNKQLWTSSYVVYTGGIALLVLGVVGWLVDVLGSRSWIAPFRAFGVNPLFAFVLSIVLTKLALRIRWSTGDGTTSLWGWLHESLFVSWLSPVNASLAFALFNVAVCLVAVWPLYRARIHVKV